MPLVKLSVKNDQTPSEFLWCLHELSDSPLLKNIFFSHLPQNVQTILFTGLETNTVDQIASMADKILEFPGQLAAPKSETQVLSIAVKPNTVSTGNILQRLDTLTQRMDKLIPILVLLIVRVITKDTVGTMTDLETRPVPVLRPVNTRNSQGTSFGRFGHNTFFQ